jgi:hypothetical protein
VRLDSPLRVCRIASAIPIMRRLRSWRIANGQDPRLSRWLVHAKADRSSATWIRRLDCRLPPAACRQSWVMSRPGGKILQRSPGMCRRSSSRSVRTAIVAITSVHSRWRPLSRPGNAPRISPWWFLNDRCRPGSQRREGAFDPARRNGGSTGTEIRPWMPERSCALDRIDHGRRSWMTRQD